MKNATVFAAFLLGGCATGYNGATVAPPTLPIHGNATHNTLIYALSPANARIVEFDIDSKGSSKPARRIVGSRTLLTGATGLQVDTDGTIYVLKTNPTELLVFASDAHANASPERIIRLKGTDPNLTMGLALDGSGNAWVADAATNQLLCYKVTGKGSTSPIAHISSSITAHGNVLNVTPQFVAWQNGTLYATWGVLYNHYPVGGLSEYSVQGRHARLTKWFVGGGNATVNINSPSLDDSGNIYLTAFGRGTDVEEYHPTFKSGTGARSNRSFGDTLVISWIQSTVEGGSLSYLATDKGIAVFGPTATRFTHPLRLITDPVDLQYTNRNYGAPLLAIH